MARNNPSVKDIREKAEAIVAGGVKNGEAYENALKTMFECIDKIGALGEVCNMLADLSSRLGDLATRYAETHEKALDVPMREIRNGIRQGEVTFGNATYLLTASFRTPTRVDGGNITEAFVSTLPDEWKKTKTVVDWTAAKKSEGFEEKLAELGLERKLAKLWSRTLTQTQVGD